MIKRLFGIILAVLTLFVVSKVVVVVVIVLGALIFQNASGDIAKDISSVGNIAGLLFGVWLAWKVLKYFAKEK